MKRFLFVLSFLTVVSMPLNVSAYDYTINSCFIDLNVNENNTFNITENITAYFHTPKHGIFRKIPLKNEVTRLDGTKSYNRAVVYDISVSDQFTAYNENGNKVIKIGDPNETLTGEENYLLSYSYNLGRDTGVGYDELYFNLIGSEWDTVIDNVSFKITMPKSFDESKLGFSAGAKYSTESKNVNYSVKENVITGSYTGIISPGESLTVRLELPDGYFTGAGANFNSMTLICLILPVTFTLIFFLLWCRYGKDNAIVETVEFYPPGGLNSAETGFLYKGESESKDIVSLLIHLANKGYLKISEAEKKTLFSKRSEFKLTKIKKYDGSNENEKIFLKGLFKDSKQVTMSDLHDKFYVTLNEIRSNLNSKENKEKIFEKSSLRMRVLGIAMIAAAFLLMSIIPVLEYQDEGYFAFALIVPGIGFVIASGSPKIKRGMFFFLCIIEISTIFLLTILVLSYSEIYVLIYLIGILCYTIMLILLKYMKKRTPYGNEMLGKIRGFKKFLEAAEKEKLEMLVMDDSEYFYNILPYTYVLGVSYKWVKKFDVIALKAPDWYDAGDTFNTRDFTYFINSSMSSAASAMTSSPSSSDESSGGGSSGGGSGGGGGGSW